MTLRNPQNARLVKPGIVVEAVPDTFETGTDFAQLAVRSVDVSANSSNEKFIETGQLGPTAVYITAESFSGSMPFDLRFNSPGLYTALAAGMRDAARPSEVSSAVTGIDYLTAGTHNDGSTGPQIIGRLSTTVFDSLAAASSGGLGGLSLKITGAANNSSAAIGEKRVKEVWKNGTDSFIDLDPRYHNAASGWGSALTADTAEAITIDAGAAMIAQNVTTPGGNKTYSMVGQMADLTNKWAKLSGCVFGHPSFNVDGRGRVSGEMSVAGSKFVPLVANPITPNVIDATNVFQYKGMVGGRHSTRIVIATDTQTLVLTDGTIKNLNINTGSEVTPLEEAQGAIGPDGYLWNSLTDPGVSFSYHVNDSAEVAALAALSQDAGREQCGFQLWLTDASGNEILVSIPDGEPEYRIHTLGSDSDGAVEMEFSLMSFEPSGVRPQFVLQFWAV